MAGMVGLQGRVTGNVDHMVLLNGADGMSDMFAKALTVGGTGLGLARQLLAAMGGADSVPPAPNGSRPMAKGHPVPVKD